MGNTYGFLGVSEDSPRFGSGSGSGFVDPYQGGLRLLDRVRERIRVRHYSLRTEKSYVGWVRRFVLFHGSRHPLELGKLEVEMFLTDLAVRGKVSASTQNQALSALLFVGSGSFSLMEIFKGLFMRVCTNFTAGKPMTLIASAVIPETSVAFLSFVLSMP